MKEILLTKGYVAIVSDEDYDRVAKYKWHCITAGRKGSKRHYAVRKVRDENGKQHNQYMHRFILEVTERSVDVDHRNGDTLNNTRENLRACTRSQNAMNRYHRVVNKTGFRGVMYVRSIDKYRASITAQGKHYYIGVFPTAAEAGAAYTSKAKELFGEFHRGEK